MPFLRSAPLRACALRRRSCREIRISVVAPAAGVPVKYEFRWSRLAAGVPAKYGFRWSRLAAPQLPRNMNFGGRNSISHYLCYVNIRFRYAPRNKACGVSGRSPEQSPDLRPRRIVDPLIFPTKFPAIVGNFVRLCVEKIGFGEKTHKTAGNLSKIFHSRFRKKTAL